MMSDISVLVIDDNVHMVRILTAMLRGFGIRKVHTVQDPASALETLKNTPIDMIVVDLRLPVLDGIEFTSLVRNSKDSPNPFVPIIMVTAHSERSKVQAARDAGVTEFCCKPLTANTLFQRISAVVEHNRPFIRTATYFGPDRRRRTDPNYKGPERRKPADEFSLE